MAHSFRKQRQIDFDWIPVLPCVETKKRGDLIMHSDFEKSKEQDYGDPALGLPSRTKGPKSVVGPSDVFGLT